MRCFPGSVRTSMIESECRDPGRPGSPPSVPSTRIVVAVELRSPFWCVSRCLTLGGTRSLASPTLLESAR